MDVLLTVAAAFISVSSFSSTIPTAAAAAAADFVPSRNIEVAIEEMQRANYFTFVMLINMAPPDLIQGNLTFLMPNDKALSKTTVIVPSQDSVADFLLRHSIPSPLLFQHLDHFPTASILPTSKTGLFLRITNHGRRHFFLNNVRLVSPNICTRGSSIRCHGIDAVIQDLVLRNGPPPPPPPHHCQNTSSTSPPLQPAPPPAALSPPPVSGFDTQPSHNATTSSSTATAPPPVGPADSNKNSASLHIMCCSFGICKFLATAMCLIILLLL